MSSEDYEHYLEEQKRELHHMQQQKEAGRVREVIEGVVAELPGADDLWLDTTRVPAEGRWSADLRRRQPPKREVTFVYKFGEGLLHVVRLTDDDGNVGPGYKLPAIP